MPITSDVLIGLLFLACVASVPLAGGRLAQLSTLQFRAPWLLIAAIAGQVLIVSVFPGSGSEALHTTVHIGTYVDRGALRRARTAASRGCGSSRSAAR